MSEDNKVGKGVKFERIRRITGYLVGTLDRFNNAKKAEVQDRVKHTNLKNEQYHFSAPLRILPTRTLPRTKRLGNWNLSGFLSEVPVCQYPDGKKVCTPCDKCDCPSAACFSRCHTCEYTCHRHNKTADEKDSMDHH